MFGQRQWHGTVVCPLLFEGQYADSESGWAYNRFRCYSPNLGFYGAQEGTG
ncbi:RHS repeat-associated core domain-containing protein [Corynebacterium suicordis]